MNAVSKTNRIEYLDATRAIALLLGVAFHASLSFLPIFIGWAVMDVSTNLAVGVFILISHSFRMALFFLLAGFFSRMALQAKGMSVFVKSRLMRIGIPFLVGWVLLRPMLVSGWVMGAESLRGDVNIGGALLNGIKSLIDMPQEFLVGTHLWFLYYLLVISAVVVFVRQVFKQQPFIQGIDRGIDRMVGKLCQSHYFALVLAAPTAAVLWFMQTWSVDTPDKSLVPHLPVLIIYGAFFLFGWLLHRDDLRLANFGRVSGVKIAIAVIAILGAIVLSPFEMQAGHEHYAWLKVGFIFAYAVMMWSLVALTLGLCKKIFNGTGSIVKYIADASYWIYLIHLPIVVWLQVAVAELEVHWSVKWPGVFLTTLAISLLLYETIVRKSVIGHVLNGKRHFR